MRWAALYRCPPILRGVSASQIRADHATNQARIGSAPNVAPVAPLFAGERREPPKQFGLMMVRNRRISMKNARELMLEYTAFSFREPKKAAEMFAEDGAF